LLQAVHGEPVRFVHDDEAGGIGDKPQLRLVLLEYLEVGRGDGNGTTMDVTVVVAVLRAPCFVAKAYFFKASARFVTCRSLRCARQDFTSAAEIIADLRRGRDHIGCIEDRVERLSIRGANAPAINGQDTCALAEMDAEERLSDTRWPVAETDIAVAPASLAKLDEPSVLQRLDENWKFATRCSSA
jgi:hypothetical protein